MECRFEVATENMQKRTVIVFKTCVLFRTLWPIELATPPSTPLSLATPPSTLLGRHSDSRCQHSTVISAPLCITITLARAMSSSQSALSICSKFLVPTVASGGTCLLLWKWRTISSGKTFSVKLETRKGGGVASFHDGRVRKEMLLATGS